MIENSVFLLEIMHEGAIQRMLGRHASVVAGHDRVEYGDEPGSLAYYRGAEQIARYRYEVLATLDREMHLFRWGWADRAGVLPKRVDAIYREGQESELSALAESQLHDVREADAARLIALGAHLAGATGLVRCDGEGRTTWLALFDEQATRATICPPASLKEPAPIQTMPPGPGGFVAATPAHAVRTPAQRGIQHVLGAMRDDLRASFMGFREALFTIRIDLRQDKARFVVHVSVLDGDGRLQVLDPSMALMDACARFIRADSDEGNGRWQRLAVRLSADLLGANLTEISAV